MATGGAVSDDGLEFWLSMIIFNNLLSVTNILLYADKSFSVGSDASVLFA